jgi:hypothetical protein
MLLANSLLAFSHFNFKIIIIKPQQIVSLLIAENGENKYLILQK